MVEFRHAEEYEGIHVGDRVRLVGNYGDVPSGTEGTVTEITYMGPVSLAVKTAIGHMQGAVRPTESGGAVVDLSKFAFREEPPVMLPGGWRFIVAVQGHGGFHLSREGIEKVPKAKKDRPCRCYRCTGRVGRR